MRKGQKMKSKLPQVITNFIITSVILLLISSCATTRKTDYYEDAAIKATELIKKGKYDQAKAVLLEAMSKEKPRRAPFVENGVLYSYAQNPNQSMMAMMTAAAFHSVKDKDSVRKNPGSYKVYFEIYDKIPWFSAAAKLPSFPTLYFIMGSLLISERNYNKAIEYLDTAVYMYEGFGYAWSEMIFAYMELKNFSKAKEIGKIALDITEVKFDKEGSAAIYRKLGYLAIEENDLDLAEEYYKKSIENQDSRIARDELKYIEQLKSKGSK
jgi:tetratricopeptide (TPR) repeat protein